MQPVRPSTWLLLSALLLVPVYWLPHVEAGDLSSHVYNAWLAQLIGQGHAPGLVIAWQNSNVLFDLMLAALFPVGGAEFAQRASVSIAVLIFVWGAFRFLVVISGKRPWHLLPCVAMLAYGWVYHMGFFNFYLSMGLCLWALALAWRRTPRAVALALPLLAAGYLAHALPVVWAGGLSAYWLLTGRMSPRARAYVMAGWYAAMVGVNMVAGKLTLTRWSVAQIRTVSGADQLWVFDGKYQALLVLLLMAWLLLLVDLVKRQGAAAVFLGVPFQLCAMSAAAIFVLPSAVQLPGYHHFLTFITDRMSLTVGVCVCALLAGGTPRWPARFALFVVSALFFGCLYRDERMLNMLEARMERAVARLQPGARVVSAVVDPELRTFAVNHMIDRVCIGHCFSYANYEPSTLAFRVRTARENGIVVADYEDSSKMAKGDYVIKERDLPLFQLFLTDDGSFSVRPLQPGAVNGTRSLESLAGLIPAG
jgi:hypothetical protein